MCLLLSADMVHLQKHSAGLSALCRACLSFVGLVCPLAGLSVLWRRRILAILPKAETHFGNAKIAESGDAFRQRKYCRKRTCPPFGGDAFRQRKYYRKWACPSLNIVESGLVRPLAETLFGNAFRETHYEFLQCVSSFRRTWSTCRNTQRACPSFGGPVRPSA